MSDPVRRPDVAADGHCLLSEFTSPRGVPEGKLNVRDVAKRCRNASPHWPSVDGLIRMGAHDRKSLVLEPCCSAETPRRPDNLPCGEEPGSPFHLRDSRAIKREPCLGGSGRLVAKSGSKPVVPEAEQAIARHPGVSPRQGVRQRGAHIREVSG